MIAGRDSPNHGEAKNSWLTGTAAWNYVAITQWILGLRPDFDGLCLAPILPSNWKGYAAARRFRGAIYHITVERAGPGNQVSMSAEGVPIPGSLLPLPTPGQTEINVRVVLA